jgi:mono/diheme cytochrome c family protein
MLAAHSVRSKHELHFDLKKNIMTITRLIPTALAGIAFASFAAAQDPTVASTPPLPTNYLAWSAEAQEYQAKAGEMAAHFTFFVTNVSTQTVVIHSLTRACGCTEAKLPEQPWQLAPGTNGPITATIDLRGKSGRISKPLTVNSSAGSKVLWLNVTMPVAPAGAGSFNMERDRNIELARANRQVVFTGECAKCHAEPTAGKLGQDLYVAGCAICHDAEHRAAMVPDLHALMHPTNAAYWKEWITFSRPGSLMPAFGKDHGGPLSEEQIGSLITYLVAAIPGRTE